MPLSLTSPYMQKIKACLVDIFVSGLPYRDTSKTHEIARSVIVRWKQRIGLLNGGERLTGQQAEYNKQKIINFFF